MPHGDLSDYVGVSSLVFGLGSMFAPAAVAAAPAASKRRCMWPSGPDFPPRRKGGVICRSYIGLIPPKGPPSMNICLSKNTLAVSARQWPR